MEKDATLRHLLDLCRKNRQWDTVLVEYDDYATYCKAASLPTQMEEKR